MDFSICLIVIFMVHDIENMCEKFQSRLTTFRFISALYNFINFFCSVYGVHGTLFDRLELKISTPKSVLKKKYQLMRYCPKYVKIWAFCKQFQTLPNNCNHLQTLANTCPQKQTPANTRKHLKVLANSCKHMQTFENKCNIFQILSNTC